VIVSVNYCSFAYSGLACFRTGMSGSGRRLSRVLGVVVGGESTNADGARHGADHSAERHPVRIRWAN